MAIIDFRVGKNEFSGPSLYTFKSFNVGQQVRAPDR